MVLDKNIYWSYSIFYTYIINLIPHVNANNKFPMHFAEKPRRIKFTLGGIKHVKLAKQFIQRSMRTFRALLCYA